MQSESFLLPPGEGIPNNPRLPVLVYRGALAAATGGDPAGAFEEVFRNNGWAPQWRAGVYAYHHYHTTTHEVLGVARGSATLMLGGPDGHELGVEAGDALLLPAGTGHCALAASDDFLVVGAYPPGQHYDMCSQPPAPGTAARVSRVPFPDVDPVQGATGPLTREWAIRAPGGGAAGAP